MLSTTKTILLFDKFVRRKSNLDLSYILHVLEVGKSITPSDAFLIYVRKYVDDVEIIRFFLDRDDTLKNTTGFYCSLRQIIQSRNKSWSPKMLELLLNHAKYLGDKPDANEAAQRLGKYAQLTLLILRNDEVQIIDLLAAGDYESYYDIIDDMNTPVTVAIKFDSHNALKTFLAIGVGLEDVYLQASCFGKLDLIEECTAQSGFNLQAVNKREESALHLACKFNQLETAKVLIDKYGLRLDARDSRGRTPVFCIQYPNTLNELLKTYPEIEINVSSKNGCMLLQHKLIYCNIYAALLENGADPTLMKPPSKHCDCMKNNGCAVIQYMQKLALIIDQESQYFSSISSMKLTNFKSLISFNKEQFEAELTKMKSLRISWSTLSTSGKSLFDVIFLDANEAARYSRNEKLLEIYENHEQDFKKYLPHYGFILNYKFRKGTVRCQRLKAAHDLLCFALGVVIPELLTVTIFGYFNNQTLDRFSIVNLADEVE